MLVCFHLWLVWFMILIFLLHVYLSPLNRGLASWFSLLEGRSGCACRQCLQFCVVYLHEHVGLMFCFRGPCCPLAILKLLNFTLFCYSHSFNTVEECLMWTSYGTIWPISSWYCLSCCYTHSHMQFVFLFQNGYIAVTFANGRKCCLDSSFQSASCLWLTLNCLTKWVIIQHLSIDMVKRMRTMMKVKMKMKMTKMESPRSGLASVLWVKRWI